MKSRRVIFASLALIALIFLPSCGKGKSGSNPKTIVDGIIEGVEGIAVPVAGGKAAYVIRTGAAFWSLADGKLKWEESLQLGTELSVTGPAVKASSEGKEYSVLPVKLDTGKDGYVIDSQIGEGDSLAVVTTDLAILYKQPKDAAMSSIILPKMNVIVVTNDPANPEFLKFAGYHSETYARYDQYYVLASDVSVVPDDVNTALLLDAARSMKKKEQRQKLVGTIASKYPTSVFTSVVQEYRIALDPASMGTEPVGSAYTIKSVGIVRDIPSVFGAEVKRLKAGDEADVAEWTTESFTIGEDSARWFKISSPVEGWIFGAALEPAK
jgi:hypothetical protein